jgi:alkylation response protein AidB-like acyl-CoA dehydrogenase
MDTGLTEDQAAVRDVVRRMARRDLAPGYLDCGACADFPWEVYRQVAGLGVLGLLAGPAHNAFDTEDFVAAGLAVEELAYADVNVANAVIPVLRCGSNTDDGGRRRRPLRDYGREDVCHDAGPLGSDDGGRQDRATW